MQVRRGMATPRNCRLDHPIGGQVEDTAPGRRTAPEASDPTVDRVEEPGAGAREKCEPPALQAEEEACSHADGERRVHEHVGGEGGRM